MKKSIYFTLCCCIMVMLSTISCSRDAELRKGVEEANKSCPMSLGLLGELTSVTYEDGNVVFLYTIDEEFVKIEALNSYPDLTKENAVTFVNNATGSLKELLDMLDSAGAGMIFVYKGKESGKTARVELDKDDIKEALKESAGNRDAMAVLKTQLKVTNAQMPATIDEGMEMTAVYLDNSFVVYKIVIDENLYSIDAIRDDYAQVKAEIKETLTAPNPVLSQFLGLCKENNVGIAYKYVGAVSGESVSIEFPASELSK